MGAGRPFSMRADLPTPGCVSHSRHNRSCMIAQPLACPGIMLVRETPIISSATHQRMGEKGAGNK
jgi:hypothetical protein